MFKHFKASLTDTVGLLLNFFHLNFTRATDEP